MSTELRKSLAIVALCGLSALCADNEDEKSECFSRLYGKVSLTYENERAEYGFFGGRHMLCPKVKLGYHINDNVGVYIGTNVKTSLKNRTVYEDVRIPSFGFGMAPLTLTVAHSGNGRFTEVDPLIGIEWMVTDALALDVGYKHYFFTGVSSRETMGAKRDDGEIHAELGYNTKLFGQTLVPSVFSSYCFDRRGLNFEGKVAYCIDLSEVLLDGLGMDLGAKIGYYRLERPFGKKLHDGFKTVKRMFGSSIRGAGISMSNHAVYLGANADLSYRFDDRVCAKVGVSVEGNTAKKKHLLNQFLSNGKRHFVWFRTGIECEF